MSPNLLSGKKSIGQEGEELAWQYLKNKGYQLIEKNFQNKWGELDLVVKAPDETLVFVEVKTLQKEKDFKPEDHLTLRKIKKLKNLASFYSMVNQKLIKENKGWRLDLIAVVLETETIRHYENILQYFL